MALSPKQFRAVDWFAKRDGLRIVAPSPMPNIIFRDKEGNEVQHNVSDITAWYDGRRAADKRNERQEKSNN